MNKPIIPNSSIENQKPHTCIIILNDDRLNGNNDFYSIVSFYYLFTQFVSNSK